MTMSDPPDAPGRGGRPRDGGIDRALIEAIRELFTELPPGDITLRMLTARAGVTRGAFYRRFGSLAHFYVELALAQYPVDLEFDTGTLRGDLLFVQDEQVAMFTDLLAQHVMPLLISALTVDEAAARAFAEHFLLPRRTATVRALARAVARGEIAAPRDVDFVLDLLSGPLFFRAAVPGLPPIDEGFAARAVDIVMAELHRSSERS